MCCVRHVGGLIRNRMLYRIIFPIYCTLNIYALLLLLLLLVLLFGIGLGLFFSLSFVYPTNIYHYLHTTLRRILVHGTNVARKVNGRVKQKSSLNRHLTETDESRRVKLLFIWSATSNKKSPKKLTFVEFHYN